MNTDGAMQSKGNKAAEYLRSQLQENNDLMGRLRDRLEMLLCPKPQAPTTTISGVAGSPSPQDSQFVNAINDTAWTISRTNAILTDILERLEI